MRIKARWNKYSPLFVGGAIPTIIILSSLFNWPKRTFIPVVVVLTLTFAVMILWAYANKEVDGAEWWQDESASGWRGY